MLIGEASHGTHEFYRERAELTKRLIAEGRCAAVAVEADWPDAYRVNHYVRGFGDDESAEEALSDFRRFPVWMWRNEVVAEFVDWLREHNEGLPESAAKVPQVYAYEAGLGGAEPASSRLSSSCSSCARLRSRRRWTTRWTPSASSMPR